MPRKVKSEALKTRQKILSSAVSLFAKNGYDHTTFTDIAARLNMTKGAVYWHFKTKQHLLVAVIGEMLEGFKKEILKLLPAESGDLSVLSFPVVADMMVRLAENTVNDRRRRESFLLLNEQISWASESMDEVRENFMKNNLFGPWHAFNTSLKNDLAARRIRADVSTEQISSCCMALWNGLVRSKITHFLRSDLCDTLNNAYRAIWRDIKV